MTTSSVIAHLVSFIQVAGQLELAGLVWQPEIGDEISYRKEPEMVSILVDPQGMTPIQLRSSYLWLPSVEQMVVQLEARQAILFHAGLELNEKALGYKTVIQSPIGAIESCAESFRLSMGLALKGLLLADSSEIVH